MNALPIPLRFPVEHGVFVLGQHLGLAGHRLLPYVEGLQRLALFRKRLVDRRYNRIDGPQTLPVPRLLESGKSPGNFPVSIEFWS